MLSHLLVVGQVAGLLAIMVPAGKPFSPNIPGIALLIIAAGVGISALLVNRPGNFGVYPEVRPGAYLITIGPYDMIRHPMYTAVLVGALGLWAMNIGMLSTVGYVVLAGVLWQKSLLEEQFLSERFPEYGAYLERTYRFVPFII
ncbi:MAG: methyltransferase [Pseudomonadota bacterium]